ncbi:ribonuclease PH [Dehalogenimonas etheniformans]|uniref:Ribonuclease PH n=1 Tax=Dehalogenimonas etheniformans TaxID=1536648 RepID=A0A2P5P5Q4_9CHLR|nr:ribonuclease PH [Dehalogenimonas etheniformans]PPD57623.1 ribonuclease PH [Dehalogenimonas etheniformans]QNT75964.1 ribonuclease PH [Dehalogenimonas etheniformans]
MPRLDGRALDQLRPIKITAGFQTYAEGSVLIEQGNTRVVVSVTMEDRVPPFLKNSGTGWVTAEYAMLPRSTSTRTPRDSAGKISGRSQEIQRLVGRSLRAVTDLAALGERSFTVDCDVLQADAGTRTASITGGYVALYLAFSKLHRLGIFKNMPLRSQVAAVSVSVYKGNILLDPAFEEDCNAESDFNLVMNSRGEFIEVQGTAEKKAYAKETLEAVIAMGEKGIRQLFEIQAAAIKGL